MPLVGTLWGPVGVTTSHPNIYVFNLEFPEPADSVGRHVFLDYPGVDGVLCDPKVLGNHISRHPRLSHLPDASTCQTGF